MSRTVVCDVEVGHTSNDIFDTGGIGKDVKYVLGGFSLFHNMKLKASHSEYGWQQISGRLESARSWNHVDWRRGE